MSVKRVAVVEEPSERILFTTRLSKSLVKKIKFIALDEDKEIYAVVEEAFRLFIKSKEK